jgi:hypothetical protein
MLGDEVAKALEYIGMSEEAFERMIGGPCACDERRRLLNGVEAWARRIASGRTEGAVAWLHRILGL